MLHSLLAGIVVVGFLAVTTLAEPPRTSAKRPAKKNASRATTSPTSASKSPASSKASTRTGNSVEKRPEPISKERAEAAVRFARRHHSELAKLLEGLRKSNEAWAYGRGSHAAWRDLVGRLLDRGLGKPEEKTC